MSSTRHTRRCRHCNKPVPKTRYFYCKDCVPMGTEHEMHVAHEYLPKAKYDNTTKIDLDGVKKCSVCKLMKLKDLFGRRSSTKDGLTYECRTCYNLKYKDRNRNVTEENQYANFS